MGLYERYICPTLTEWVLSNPWVEAHRRDLLAPLEGRVLEIGFGSGLNLPHYPASVRELDLVEPALGMHAKARRRLAAHADRGPAVRVHEGRAEALPFSDATFDAVVCTFTLCTVSDPLQAVGEARRVLRPGGALRLFEHVASNNPSVRAWQDRLNPVQNVLGCGCNLNRDVEAVLVQGGFRDGDMRRIQEPRTPKLVREHLFGSVTKTD